MSENKDKDIKNVRLNPAVKNELDKKYVDWKAEPLRMKIKHLSRSHYLEFLMLYFDFEGDIEQTETEFNKRREAENHVTKLS